MKHNKKLLTFKLKHLYTCVCKFITIYLYTPISRERYAIHTIYIYLYVYINAYIYLCM